MSEATQNDTPVKSLTQSLQTIHGIGPSRARTLGKLGLRSTADALFFFPRKYQDFTQLSLVEDLEENEPASIVGEVDDVDQQKSQNGRHITYVLIRAEDGFVRAIWFNQEYMFARFQKGQRVLFRGTPKLQGSRFQITHPKVTWLDEETTAEQEQRMLPVYRLTDGTNQYRLRELIQNIVENYADLVEEAFPPDIREETGLCDIQTAIRQIHNPASEEELEEARSRLVYQELLILQLALAMRRWRLQSSSVSPNLELTPKIRARIEGRVPFELTDSQQSAFAEIAADMGRKFPMNRLLHGEVGSGKTVVAVCAMLLAVAHGHQAAIMAPTEILARQHFRTFSELLARSRVRIALWTGSQKTSERKKIAAQVAAGEVDLVIGTHAVVASSLEFNKLGLAVIDEQHKFGVAQRAKLKQAGFDPHYLVMTATPIPRTISMTLFGDLDVSILQRTTVGQQVNTYLGSIATRDSWWEFFRKKLRQGRQGYVVAPLVKGEDDDQLASAEKMYESLSNGPLEEFRLDVIHGKQTPEEKELAMQSFSEGKTQVLVATGVIEVGINVPNATIMTIESAERFGLSQLHQLRGRISRGSHAGFVCAFATADNAEENQRLKAFEEHNDGFSLAEIDLQIRGPGNLFSTQQTGFPPLHIADLVRDEEVLATTQKYARKLIAENPDLAGEGLQRLRQLVLARYGKALELSDVG